VYILTAALIEPSAKDSDTKGEDALENSQGIGYEVGLESCSACGYVYPGSRPIRASNNVCNLGSVLQEMTKFYKFKNG
jgi:hypothetical protein